MDLLKYENMIHWTLSKIPSGKRENSLDVARRILSNLEVPFPRGRLTDVVHKMGSKSFMGWQWRPFSAIQAQQCINSGYVVIGIGINGNNRVTVALPENSRLVIDNTLQEDSTDFYARPLSCFTLGELQQTQFFSFVDFK